MTKEILNRAIELDRDINRTEKWLKEIREGEEIFWKERHTGYFSLSIKLENGAQISIQITADAAIKAIKNAKDEISKEKERLSDIFKKLS